jgi:peptidoglycan/LPS O-acetylase OafA/YrhL
MSILATALLVVFSLTYSLIPIAEFPKTLLLLALFLLLIPFAFIFQDHHRIDNWIGNLSYPIYIGHMLVIRVIGFTSKLSSHIIDSHTIAATTVLLSIVFAIALNKWVGEPFEAIRRKIRMKARPIHTRSVPEMP